MSAVITGLGANERPAAPRYEDIYPPTKRPRVSALKPKEPDVLVYQVCQIDYSRRHPDFDRRNPEDLARLKRVFYPHHPLQSTIND